MRLIRVPVSAFVPVSMRSTVHDSDSGVGGADRLHVAVVHVDGEVRVVVRAVVDHVSLDVFTLVAERDARSG